MNDGQKVVRIKVKIGSYLGNPLKLLEENINLKFNTTIHISKQFSSANFQAFFAFLLSLFQTIFLIGAAVAHQSHPGRKKSSSEDEKFEKLCLYVTRFLYFVIDIL